SNNLNQSGLEILKQLFSNDMVTFSPLSCGLALSGILLGTESNSARELSSCLKISNTNELVDNFKQITSNLNERSEHTIVRLITALYVQHDFQLNENFLTDVSK